MKKNVLIFGHGYADGFIEATNQYIRLFNPKYYHVTIVYLNGLPDDRVVKKHLTDNIIFLNRSDKIKRGLKIETIKTLLKLHREKKFQIVICHRYKPTYIMLWVARFCPIPALFSVMHEMNTLKNMSRRLLVALLAAKNIFFAGVSNAVREDIRKNIWRIPQQNIITLYNAIDIKLTESQLESRETARNRMGLSKDDFIFGILGRLVPAKDHKTLINAFALAKPHCPKAKLVIIGEGELESSLKDQIKRLQLGNDVIMTGFLPKAFSLLTALDVFTLSSVKEAFGRVLLEAMIARVALLATNTNGIPEVVGDVGFLVEKMNPSQMADKMVSLYQMPSTELTHMGEKSYSRAVNVFSMEQFQQSFWQLPLLHNMKM